MKILQDSIWIIQTPLGHFAATYDCGAYGAGTYDQSSTTSCTAATNSGTSGNLLPTGSSIILPLALGFVLIISGLILIFRRKRTRK